MCFSSGLHVGDDQAVCINPEKQNSYLRRLLDDAAVIRFLSQVEPAMMGEFQNIVDLADMKATG